MSSRQDAVISDLEAAITGPLAGLGLDVEAVELTPAGRRRVLRVAVDGDDGVDLDMVASATKAISAVLDAPENDALLGQQPYTLEVTSRGVDRPLTAPRHWRRNADRLVRVSLVEGGDLVGRIGPSDEESVEITPQSAKKGGPVGAAQRVPYTDIAKAIVQIEFNRRSAGDEEDA